LLLTILLPYILLIINFQMSFLYCERYHLWLIFLILLLDRFLNCWFTFLRYLLIAQRLSDQIIIIFILCFLSLQLFNNIIILQSSLIPLINNYISSLLLFLWLILYIIKFASVFLRFFILLFNNWLLRWFLMQILIHQFILLFL